MRWAHTSQVEEFEAELEFLHVSDLVAVLLLLGMVPLVRCVVCSEHHVAGENASGVGGMRGAGEPRCVEPNRGEKAGPWKPRSTYATAGRLMLEDETEIGTTLTRTRSHFGFGTPRFGYEKTSGEGEGVDEPAEVRAGSPFKLAARSAEGWHLPSDDVALDTHLDANSLLEAHRGKEDCTPTV